MFSIHVDTDEEPILIGESLVYIRARDTTRVQVAIEAPKHVRIRRWNVLQAQMHYCGYTARTPRTERLREQLQKEVQQFLTYEANYILEKGNPPWLEI